jgi:hypothetical protein
MPISLPVMLRIVTTRSTKAGLEQLGAPKRVTVKGVKKNGTEETITVLNDIDWTDTALSYYTDQTASEFLPFGNTVYQVDNDKIWGAEDIITAQTFDLTSSLPKETVYAKVRVYINDVHYSAMDVINTFPSIAGFDALTEAERMAHVQTTKQCRINKLQLWQAPHLSTSMAAELSEREIVGPGGETACGGPQVFDGSSEKDLQQQDILVGHVLKYMGDTTCKRRMEVAFRAKQDAEAAMAAKGQIGPFSASGEASASAKAHSDIQSRFANATSGCESTNMLIKAATVSQKQATCVLNRLENTTTNTAFATIKMSLRIASTADIEGSAGQVAIQTMTLRSSSEISSEVIQDLKSVMETMLATVSEQSAKTTTGSFASQNAVKNTGIDTSSVNTANMKDLVNESINTQVNNLQGDIDMTFVVEGRVRGNVLQLAQQKLTLVATSVVSSVVKQTLSDSTLASIMSSWTQKNTSDSRGLDTITGQIADVANNAIDTAGNFVLYIVIGLVALLVLGGGVLRGATGSFSAMLIHRKKLLGLLCVVGIICIVAAILLFMSDNLIGGLVAIGSLVSVVLAAWYVYRNNNVSQIPTVPVSNSVVKQ